jgi:DNA-binding CsgD family transcriptional regulator
MQFLVDFIKSKAPELSEKEAECIRLSAEGLSVAEIAEEISRGIDTVKTHLKSAYRKLGVHNIKQALSMGYIKGFLKGRDVMLAVLVLNSVSSLLTPGDAYANDDWAEEQHSSDMQRNRKRGGSRSRAGSQLQLRKSTRRKED